MAVDVLGDTSVWIDFFRNKSLPSSRHLAYLLEADRVSLTGIILTELLRGARNSEELTAIRRLLRPVPMISADENTWDNAGELASVLARKGFKIFTVDAIIASIAIQNGLELLTRDRHFDQISLHSELRVHKY